ncbi:family 43 glycosylhydrolase [Streptomyces sp. NPDC088258]|uniref:family 43 glycosylhydrolase n=1 Tax=Streptomyces sp. NPDC088258 TaxID=3365849 RepID=UPI003823D21C
MNAMGNSAVPRRSLLAGAATGVAVMALGSKTAIATAATGDGGGGGDDLEKLYGSLAHEVEDDYTPASWAAFGPVRAATATLLAGSPLPQQRQEARTALAAAADDLVMTRGLRRFVTEYRTRDLADYTRRSWHDLPRALGAAEEVLRTDDATRTDIVHAKNALQQAAAGLTPTAAHAFGEIRNDTFWRDTDGNPIYSQGGGVFRFGDTYYWYGVRYTGAEQYLESPTRTYDSTFTAITCYSSKDLTNWTFEKNIATPSTPLWIPSEKETNDSTFARMTNLADTSWLGRLGVVHNPNTGKYVLLAQMGNALDTDGNNGAVLFLQGDHPADDFTYATIQPQIAGVPTQSTKDQTVFADDDGTGYLVFSGGTGRVYSYVSKLAEADSLSIEPAVQIGYVPEGREGNAMFKYDGHYYVATSDLHGWNASQAYVIKSKTRDIQGEYTAEYVLPGTEKDYSHVTQTGFFVTVHGQRQDTVVFCGDRWADFAWNGLGYNQWMPLADTEDGLVFRSLSHWELNAVTGVWTTGRDNNYLLNPQFAADRVPVTQLTGWITHIDTDVSTTNFVANISPGADSTRFALKLGAGGPFSGSLSQEGTVPAGRYRLSARTKTDGGLDHARIRITGDGREYLLDLGEPSTEWRTVTRDGMRLPAGPVTVAVEVRSTAGNHWVTLDALSLTRH